MGEGDLLRDSYGQKTTNYQWIRLGLITNIKVGRSSRFKEGDIEKVVNDYWTGKLRVKARAFLDNMKMLKNRIYSE